MVRAQPGDRMEARGMPQGAVLSGPAHPHEPARSERKNTPATARGLGVTEPGARRHSLFVLGAIVCLAAVTGALARSQESASPSDPAKPDAQAATPNTGGPMGAREYTIGVEDLIQVTVWKNPDLSVTVPVRPDGKISLPLIDDVQAAGLTALQLKEDLTRRWKSFLSGPEVSVIVKEVNSFKVYLVGEVAHAGELRLKAPTRLLQAISLAGGFSTFADRGKIVLLREGREGQQRFEINYNKVVSGDKPDGNMALEPGDTIVVP
jgi:polysaccharide biosynthesis/export protein